ncbi:MAG: response regulator [Leptolyngbya sp. SIO4C1]|nr:response regulator [Leptolyngbya sp. SIO4C1]
MTDETQRLILAIEDNPDHARVIQQTLAASTLEVVAIANGEEALAFLTRQGRYATARRPDLILLDLNLPGRDGRALLSLFKRDLALRRIPIIVLTSSNSHDDIHTSYLNQSNCYVIKSEDLDQLARIVKRIEDFWFGIVTLPIELRR